MPEKSGERKVGRDRRERKMGEAATHESQNNEVQKKKGKNNSQNPTLCDMEGDWRKVTGVGGRKEG